MARANLDLALDSRLCVCSVHVSNKLPMPQAAHVRLPFCWTRHFQAREEGIGRGVRRSSTYQSRRDARISHQEAPVWRAGDPNASWRRSHAIVAVAAVELRVVAAVDGVVVVVVVVAATVSGITNALKVAEASAAALDAQLRSGEGVGSALGEVGFAIFGSPKAGSPADDQQA